MFVLKINPFSRKRQKHNLRTIENARNLQQLSGKKYTISAGKIHCGRFKITTTAESRFAPVLKLPPPKNHFDVIQNRKPRLTLQETNSSMPFPTTQQVYLPTCFPHCPFNAERQAGKL